MRVKHSLLCPGSVPFGPIAKVGKSAHLRHMSDILYPVLDKDNPDRHLTCQEALSTAFQNLLDAALAAGWSEREAIAAVADLADNQMLALSARNETNQLMALLKSMT
jgi:hypothetical protein